MNTDLIFGLLGGLGLFFFGMKLAAEGLQKVAADRLKNILHFFTSIPIVGVVVGAIVTCIIQSSSATTVMVVGFVNAGLMTLVQAISAIMGANIGTTFTAWLVSSMAVFKISHYAMPAVGIGFFMHVFGKRRNTKFWGEVILGFGLLFIGLGTLKDTFGPLGKSDQTKALFVFLSHYPILGLLLGILATCILQSSSASIALTQLLAFNGLIDFYATIPIVLGADIGTTITAQLAALGRTRAARRAALAHTIFNSILATYGIILIYTGFFPFVFKYIAPAGITQTNIMIYMALTHSAFNLFNTFMLLPFIRQLEALCLRILPILPDENEMTPEFLDKEFLHTPSLALGQSKQEIVRMLKMSKKSVNIAMDGFFNQTSTLFYSVHRTEQAIDNLQKEITEYLISLSQQTLSMEESSEIPVLLHTVNDVERIGDYSENIVEYTERRIEKKIPFTDTAMTELKSMLEEVNLMFDKIIDALAKNSQDIAYKALEHEETLNRMQVDLRNQHVLRLNEGRCDVLAGIIFVDCVDNFEKIGDHLANIAEAIEHNMRFGELVEEAQS